MIIVVVRISGDDLSIAMIIGRFHKKIIDKETECSFLDRLSGDESSERRDVGVVGRGPIVWPLICSAKYQ